MGTRGGNLDPAILDFLHHKEGEISDPLPMSRAPAIRRFGLG
jgi:acetate kinase